jgi:DNA polymerase III delta subunit
MANAIEAGDGKTALRQLALMLDAGAPPEQILGQLGWLVRTKFPFQVPAMLCSAVQSLFRTDLDLKRSAGEPRVLLERLVVELCARGAGRPSPPRGGTDAVTSGRRRCGSSAWTCSGRPRCGE